MYCNVLSRVQSPQDKTLTETEDKRGVLKKKVFQVRRCEQHLLIDKEVGGKVGKGGTRGI